MSSPFPPLQKYLGWVQRYLFTVETGTIPYPQPVLNIDLDWPLEQHVIRDSYTTIVGTVNQTILNVPTEYHAWVTHLSVSGAILAADAVGLIHTIQGLVVRLSSNTGTAVSYSPLIGGFLRTATAAAGVDGMRPIYVGPGDSLQVEHGSAAAGAAMTVRGIYIFRSKFHPLLPPQ